MDIQREMPTCIEGYIQCITENNQRTRCGKTTSTVVLTTLFSMFLSVVVVVVLIVVCPFLCCSLLGRQGVEMGMLQSGDTVVSIQGWRGGAGNTNTLRLHVVP